MNSIFGYKLSDSQYPQMKIIETPKFIFRPININDVPDFYEYLSQEKVVKYLPFKPHKNIGVTKKFIQTYFINNYKNGNVSNYAVYYKRDKKVIANTGFNNLPPNSIEGEIGICLNPKYWGHDFATELCIVSLITGFELMNLDKIIAVTYSNNKYSTKCLDILNFKHVNNSKVKNTSQTSYIFELTRNEYLGMKKNYLPNLVKQLNHA